MAEQEPELEEEQEAEEDQEAEKGAEAEEEQSPPPLIMSNLQEKISEGIDHLFSPASRKRFKERYNIQRDSPSSVASKKQKVSMGAIGEGGTTIARAKSKVTRERVKKRG